MTKFLAASVQLNAPSNPNLGIKKVLDSIYHASSLNIDLLTFPECMLAIYKSKKDALLYSFQQDSCPFLLQMRSAIKQAQVWTLAGSIIFKSENGSLVNRSLLISPQGDIVAHYDKIHMFDVSLEDGQIYKESSSYTPGNNLVIANLPFCNLGLSICYDLRFPNLYMSLASAGADVIVVPSAFIFKTGAAHWETLLRSRAIETSSNIIAPAQCGIHENGRVSWGNSMIINEWGRIIAQAGKSESFIVSEIDTKNSKKQRKAIPNLKNLKSYKIKRVNYY